MAYHLTRKWSKQKILRNYLNSIYFGNGAYGIESAARTYFGRQHTGCETNRARPCAAQLEPAEAALIAGVVASPSAYDPIAHPPPPRSAATSCSQRMLEQGLIAREQYDAGIAEPIPAAARHPAAARGDEVPLLHVLDQAAGRRPARRRPDRRAPGVRGRPDDPDHDRRALPEGGRRRDPRLAALPRRPARLAGGDREQDRRGPRDGRRRRLQQLAVQPRHPGPAPAGLGVQAVRARRGAEEGDLPHLAVVVAQEGLRRPGLDREVHGRELQRRLRGRHHARATRRRPPTTRCSPRSGSRPAPRRSPSSRAGWASARRSRTTGR